MTGNLEVKGKTILAVAAHADDMDFGASGSVAKFVEEGADVYYMLLTDGSKGSEDLNITPVQLREMRQKEQRVAAEILGLKDVFFCDFIDGELENNYTVRKEIVKVIRKLKPEIVITTDPTFVYDSEKGTINHPDHRNAGQATLDSVFPFARNSKTYPELIEEEGLGPHSVKELLMTNMKEGNFYIDISSTIEKKLGALKEHVSQYESWEDTEKRVKERAQKTGEIAGYEYAERFVRITIPN